MKNKIISSIIALCLVMSMVLVSATISTELEDNLIFALDFNQTSGGLTDIYRGIYNSTDISGVTLGNETSIDGFSAFFENEPTGNYFVLPAIAEVNANFTYVLWVYHVPAEGDSVSQYLILQRDRFANSFWVQNSGGNWYAWWFIDQSQTYYIQSNVSLTSGTWSMISFVCEDGIAKMYINDTWVGTDSVGGCSWYSGSDWIFGTSPDSNRNWGGNFDNFMLFNKSLNQTYIQTFYQNQSMYSITYTPDISIVLNTPENNSHIHLADFVNFTANISSINTIDNATFYLWNATDLVLSQFTTIGSVSEISIGTNVNITQYPDGTYYWQYNTTDNESNIAESELYQFRLHLEPPHIFWYNPTQNVFTESSTFNLNVSILDIFLDAVNVTVYNSSGDETYNNFTANLTSSTFDVLDSISLDLGINTVEICARDSMTGSPKIKDLVDDDFKKVNEEKTEFKISKDEKIDRTFVIKDADNKKLTASTHKLKTTNEWIDDGKHYKTTWELEDIPEGSYFEVVMDYEATNPLEILTDRGKTRIVDAQRTYYWSYQDMEQAGFKVQYYNDKENMQIIIKAEKGTYNPDGKKWTLDPITGGLNNICESYNITRQTAPTISIAYPINATYDDYITALQYTFTGDCESVWYSLDDGDTNVTLTCGQNATGLTSVEGLNTWMMFINNSAGTEESDSVAFNVEIPLTLPSYASTTIYQTLESFGAGIYFLLFGSAQGLGILLIAIIIISIITVIGYSIAKVIPELMKNWQNKR